MKSFRLFPKEYGGMPLIWLVYLLFPIIGILQASFSFVIIGFLLLLLFVIIYRDSYWRADYHKIHLVLELLLVFIFCLIYNPMFIYMGFYPINLLYSIKDRRIHLGTSITVVGILIVTTSHHNIPLNSPIFLATLAPTIVMALTPFAISATRKYQELQTKLDSANLQIEELIKREERQRIARDLHDTLGHTLSFITLKSEIVEKVLQRDPGLALREIKEIKETSRSTLQQVRELIQDMNVVKLSQEIQQIEKILKSGEVEVTIKGDPSSINLPNLYETILGMCLREAVTNVVKHSRASYCTIEVKEDVGEYILLVLDNGQGMKHSAPNGSGLLGMVQRLRLLNGTLDVQSEDGKGTTLVIRIPKVKRSTIESTAL